MGYLRMAGLAALGLVLVVAIVFLPAGTLDYWQGWAFVGVTFLSVMITMALFVGKTDLVQERMRPGPGTKWWDKVFYAFYVPAFFAVVVVAGLDVGRFGWTGALPAFVYAVGYAVYIASLFLNSWCMWVNRFFSSTVRIQTDRGHEVVQEGPYRFVRHPGYVAGILMAKGIALVLGSLWAVVPALIVVVLLLVRTYLEDVTLQRELPGYAEYARKVRYRLVPGVW